MQHQTIAGVQDQVKMKNKIKIVIVGMMFLLLANMALAFDYEIVSYKIENDTTSIPRYSYYCDKLGRNLEHNLESSTTYDKTVGSYEEYLQFKMQEQEDAVFKRENPTIVKAEVSIDEEVIEVEDNFWSIIKKLIEKVNELIFGVEELETDNQLLKDELCKKDSSYSWCLSVGELG